MSAHPPPVPPANRSNKGPGELAEATSHDAAKPAKAPNNTSEQGQQGNTEQNTMHPGTGQGV